MLHREASGMRRQRDQSHDPRKVRLYLLVPVLFILVPAILEFGLLLGATLSLNRLGADASEVAMVGGSPCRIAEAVQVSCRHLATHKISLVCYRRDASLETATRGAWYFLGETGSENDARPGDEIMVELEYAHRLLFGSLSAPFFGAGPDGRVRLRAATEVIRR